MKKDMSRTQQRASEREEDFSDKPTPRYDKVCENIRKLLSATCQTFIPDACRELRHDWCPNFTDAEFKEYKGAQDKIRERLLDDWSKERNSEDGIWKEDTIGRFLPDWMKSPYRQAATNLQKAREAKLLKKISITEAEKQALHRYATKLPESVIAPEPESEVNTPGYSVERQPLLRGLGESPKKNIMTIYGEINRTAKDLYMAITQEDDVPHVDEDLLVDHIRPARQQMKSFALEIKNADPGPMFEGLITQLQYTHKAIEELLRIMSELDK